MAYGGVDPTSQELNNISLACSRLWELDENRLTPGQDYRLNLQVSNHFTYNIFDKTLIFSSFKLAF
jgi:hypothetical protein